ncbi:LysR family transcriptional regulator [Alteromonas sp. 5E99-2]|uniref:LysR family transcriptional regulator n=1 Tax=Alteromonas sp. 5E99-2 TaxID=2817683 RepID=UPI001A98F9D5|nr:LysR family transcriptional regulator [Alteromonas sp. 5E99-2]MBO1254487.1 LysR family transcriptional regulator [Alteromonas sp. 5E99-2]
MKNDYFNELSVFIEVAREGGFRAASSKLQMSPGSISEAIKRLEDKLNVRLFERTTRKISLTHDGVALFQRSLPAIVDLENAVRGVSDNHTDVSGKLRLSAPPSSGPLFLNELIMEYVAKYPNVDVEVIYDAHKVNLVTAGVDGTIRANSLLEPDTYAIAIGPVITMSVVASPCYLKRIGIPETPSELCDHQGICYAFGSAETLAEWKFIGEDGEYSVKPHAKVVVNDLKNITKYAEAGLGVIYTYSEFVEQEINKGTLVPILQPFIAPLPRYTLNYLTKRHMPNRLKALIELAKHKAYP